MISNTLPQVTRWVPNLSIFGSWVISRKMENQSFFQFSSDLKFLLSVTWLNNELRLWSQEDDNHEKTCITFRKVKCIPSFMSIIYTVYDDKTISQYSKIWSRQYDDASVVKMGLHFWSLTIWPSNIKCEPVPDAKKIFSKVENTIEFYFWERWTIKSC